MYLAWTLSPTFIWSKFLTSGPAVTTSQLPLGPFSVTSRVALSMAMIVAVTSTVRSTLALPGSLL